MSVEHILSSETRVWQLPLDVPFQALGRVVLPHAPFDRGFAKSAALHNETATMRSVAYHQKLLQTAGIESGVVLNVGAGMSVCDELGDVRLVHLDPTYGSTEPRSLERTATEDLRERQGWGVAALVQELPFATGAVEGVIASYMCGYLPAGDVLRALEEVLRVIRPGGKAVFTPLASLTSGRQTVIPGAAYRERDVLVLTKNAALRRGLPKNQQAIARLIWAGC